MKTYAVPVWFNGYIYYSVNAGTEEKAMMKTQELTQKEINLGNLKDIN